MFPWWSLLSCWLLVHWSCIKRQGEDSGSPHPPLALTNVLGMVIGLLHSVAKVGLVKRITPLPPLGTGPPRPFFPVGSEIMSTLQQ